MSTLLPKQTLLTREQPAQQNRQGHALLKARGEQRWVGGDHCYRGALFFTARTPRERKEDSEGIRKKAALCFPLWPSDPNERLFSPFPQLPPT